jgi:hypothetical protein
MEEHGHLVLDHLIKDRLLQVSAATIDRVLRKTRVPPALVACVNSSSPNVNVPLRPQLSLSVNNGCKRESS